MFDSCIFEKGRLFLNTQERKECMFCPRVFHMIQDELRQISRIKLQSNV